VEKITEAQRVAGPDEGYSPTRTLYRYQPCSAEVLAQ
jgi:hypothetical protein